MSELVLLKQVPLFAALNEEELARVASICTDRSAIPGEVLVRQNTSGDELFVIADGSVEVYTGDDAHHRTIVVLGKGQVVGEMALIDYGYRSASVRATQEGCTCAVITREAFNALCQENNRIGYIVMRNLAIDLAFKVRHQNLMESR